MRCWKYNYVPASGRTVQHFHVALQEERHQYEAWAFLPHRQPRLSIFDEGGSRQNRQSKWILDFLEKRHHEPERFLLVMTLDMHNARGPRKASHQRFSG
jgi:hypothetical protein